MPGFEEFRDTLQGVVPMPISGFVCYKGQLADEQLHNLAEVLALNVAKGGFRLEGTYLVDTFPYRRALYCLERRVGTMIAEPVLCCAGCKLGDTGAKVIAEALQHNTQMVTIELPGLVLMLNALHLSASKSVKVGSIAGTLTDTSYVCRQ